MREAKSIWKKSKPLKQLFDALVSEAWQSYESKAYGVSNHHLKLESKKFSRTRDIPNFQTQGWLDTAFDGSNWIETYIKGLLAM